MFHHYKSGKAFKHSCLEGFVQGFKACVLVPCDFLKEINRLFLLYFFLMYADDDNCF